MFYSSCDGFTCMLSHLIFIMTLYSSRYHDSQFIHEEKKRLREILKPAPIHREISGEAWFKPSSPNFKQNALSATFRIL